MFPGTSSATRASAVLLCFLGLFVLTGWAIGSETMVRLIPGSVAMSINTAIMFLVGGLALASARRVGPWAGRLHLTLASVLVVLPLLILSQHIFDIDLGIDLASVHAALRDGHAKPGRTAPNACLGFLCAGIALLATRRAPRDQVAYVAALVLGVFVFTIGASAFLGYLLALDMLYQFASYNRMAALTALGMTVLGAAVWHFTAAHCTPDTSRERNEAKRVTTLAAILLVVFALSTGLASFGLLKHSFERTAITDITRTTRTSAISVSALLNKAIQLSQSVSSRPALRATLAALAPGASSTTNCAISLHWDSAWCASRTPQARSSRAAGRQRSQRSCAYRSARRNKAANCCGATASSSAAAMPSSTVVSRRGG